MVELSDALVTEAKRESTTTDDLLGLIERHHDETQGVRKETVKAYARRLDDERDYAFDAEEFLAEVDDRLTESDESATARSTNSTTSASAGTRPAGTRNSAARRTRPSTSSTSRPRSRGSQPAPRAPTAAHRNANSKT